MSNFPKIPRRLREALKQNDFELVRSGGKHPIYRHRPSGKAVPVPLAKKGKLNRRAEQNYLHQLKRLLISVGATPKGL